MGNIFSGNCKPTVDISIEKDIYTAGETIRGYLKVDYNEENISEFLEIETLAIHLVGLSNTKVGTNRESTRVTAVEQIIAGASDFQSRAEGRSSQAFPFELTVPDSAPTSFGLQMYSKCSASIQYSLGAVIKRKQKKILTHRITVQVISQPPPKLPPLHYGKDIKIYKLCSCIKVGEVVLTIDAQKRTVAIGQENPIISYKISNQTSAVVRLTLRLREFVQWYSKGVQYAPYARNGNLGDRTLSIKGVSRPENCQHHDINPGEQLEGVLELEYKKDSMAGSTKTHNIRIKHWVDAEVTTCSSFSHIVKTPLIRVPLIFYKVPGVTSNSGLVEQEQLPAPTASTPLLRTVDTSNDDELIPIATPAPFNPATMQNSGLRPLNTTSIDLSKGIGLDLTGDGFIDVWGYDTTGDGTKDMWGYDTNGDGEVDAFDTVGDGLIDSDKGPNQYAGRLLP